jgi:prepilin-type N-terminal cleavage/methylation domain-containing protein
MSMRFNQAGDTLVEVLLATAILSMVLAGAFTISNRATRINQSAEERTQVSNLMQREVELLKAKHASNPDSLWNELDDTSVEPWFAGTTERSTSFCGDTGASPSAGSFVVNTDLTLKKLDPASRSGYYTDYDDTDFFNVWIEAVDNGPASSYADFFVYACWDGVGGEGYQQSGLVVRLNR